jgi:hypothetical protein
MELLSVKINGHDGIVGVAEVRVGVIFANADPALAHLVDDTVRIPLQIAFGVT